MEARPHTQYNFKIKKSVGCLELATNDRKMKFKNIISSSIRNENMQGEDYKTLLS